MCEFWNGYTELGIRDGSLNNLIILIDCFTLNVAPMETGGILVENQQME